jgi:hypothetical protein
MSRGIAHWESRDLVIPLAISVPHWRLPDYVGAAAKARNRSSRHSCAKPTERVGGRAS